MHKIEQASQVGISPIGSGFMGRAHPPAFRDVGGVFPPARRQHLELLADRSGTRGGRRLARLPPRDP